MAPSDRDVKYRLARISDMAAIAALHADSWRRSYRGMVPDAYLDHGLDADRLAEWTQRFNDGDAQTVTILAELAGELAGFTHSFVGDDPEYGTLLDNLHVREGQKRSGIGTRLMAETATWLEERGVPSGLYLWVLEGNTAARHFYDALGGEIAGAGVSHLGGGEAPSLRYWWPQLQGLSRLLPQRQHVSLRAPDLQ